MTEVYYMDGDYYAESSSKGVKIEDKSGREVKVPKSMIIALAQKFDKSDRPVKNDESE